MEKLEIKKEVVAKLQDDELRSIKGGADTPWTHVQDGPLSCNLGDCFVYYITTTIWEDKK